MCNAGYMEKVKTILPSHDCSTTRWEAPPSWGLDSTLDPQNDVWTVTEICNKAVNVTFVVLTAVHIRGEQMK